MSFTARAVAVLLVTMVACSQPTADELPAGSVALVPAVTADSLALPDGAQLLQTTPRTPVGRIVDDAIRGARAAEIVAAIGDGAPSAYIPACTGAGDVVVIIPADVVPADAQQVLYDIVRDMDFVDITEPEVVPVGAVADLTCAAEGRPLP